MRRAVPLAGVRRDPGGAGPDQLRELLPGGADGKNRRLCPGDRRFFPKRGFPALQAGVGGAYFRGLPGVHGLRNPPQRPRADGPDGPEAAGRPYPGRGEGDGGKLP